MYGIREPAEAGSSYKIPVGPVVQPRVEREEKQNLSRKKCYLGRYTSIIEAVGVQCF